ncbi:MAG: bifunctional riboflavin kinase/FAD synthetase [Actinomycetaceae bacterium]|nr:bifunctional riboflavin kinase/FAD synthetase [Actinomycetaceae bacterium]
MQLWNGLEEVPQSLRSVVTIGNFDGVHKGHQKIIRTCVNAARSRQLTSVAITFDPHPVQVHHPERDLKLIATLEDRLDALAALGLDATLVLPYTPQLYRKTPEQFVDEVLCQALGAEEIIVGEDIRFGAGNSGDITTLRDLGSSRGFQVQMVADIESPTGRRWSSSWVRELLARGDVQDAAEVLGRPHRIRGVVQRGFKRGRELGFPTANLAGDCGGVIPADGVYAGWLIRQVPGGRAEEFLPAAISVGTNPQFDGEERTVEAHVLGRSDLNLYGEEIAITFIRRLRGMARFESVEGLLQQMDDDIREAASVLGVGVSGRVNPEDVTAQ